MKQLQFKERFQNKPITSSLSQNGSITPNCKSSHAKPFKGQNGQKLKKQFSSQGYLTPVYNKIIKKCSNHPHLKSQYFVETQKGEKIDYCQKCSILIASQGFSVIKKNINKMSSARKNQTFRSPQVQIHDQWKANQAKSMKALEKNLQSFDQTLQELSTLVDLSIRKIQQNSKQLLEELQTKFFGIFQLINQEKSSCMALILKKAEDFKEPLQNFKKQISSQRWHINKIQTNLNLIQAIQPLDISRNLQKQRNSNNFLDSYRCKINQISLKVEQLKLNGTQLARTITSTQIVKLGSSESIMLATCEKLKSMSQNSTKFCSLKSLQRGESVRSFGHEAQQQLSCPSSIRKKLHHDSLLETSLLQQLNSLQQQNRRDKIQDSSNFTISKQPNNKATYSLNEYFSKPFGI